MTTAIRHRAHRGVAGAIRIQVAHRRRRGHGRTRGQRPGAGLRRHAADDQAGELAYWPPSNEIAIFYADDGQTIPQPGLVRLGTIDTGLEVIAAAGNEFDRTIEPLD